MKNSKRRKRGLQAGFILGVVLVLLGTLDPLEGSVLVLAGSMVLAVVSYGFGDPQHKWFRLSAVLIFIGVSALWILSAYGGFGAGSELGHGWAVFILPYPVGWLILMGLFYLRLFVQKK